MALQRQLAIADQRAISPGLCWLTLHAPELSRSARAGQYLLVRCAEQGGYDPLLRRPLFLAAAEPGLGQVALLYAPDERGLAWLARGRAGDTLDVTGPFGRPFALDARTRTLLLLGTGPGLAALLLLARSAAAQNVAVTLLAGAAEAALLPPAYLLPGEVEYQTIVGAPVELLPGPPREPQEQADKQKKRKGGSAPPAAPASLPAISWADQIVAALPSAQLPVLAQGIRTTKYRWERAFAAVLLAGPLVCGVGACGVCAVEMRRGTRMLCSDGPIFDMRDLVLEG